MCFDNALLYHQCILKLNNETTVVVCTVIKYVYLSTSGLCLCCWILLVNRVVEHPLTTFVLILNPPPPSRTVVLFIKQTTKVNSALFCRFQ